VLFWSMISPGNYTPISPKLLGQSFYAHGFLNRAHTGIRIHVGLIPGGRLSITSQAGWRMRGSMPTPT